MVVPRTPSLASRVFVDCETVERVDAVICTAKAIMTERTTAATRLSIKVNAWLPRIGGRKESRAIIRSLRPATRQQGERVEASTSPRPASWRDAQSRHALYQSISRRKPPVLA